MTKTIRAAELDKLFDEGKEDVLQYFDLSSIKKVNDPDSPSSTPCVRQSKHATSLASNRVSAKKPSIA